jgi:hypothetical protein
LVRTQFSIENKVTQPAIGFCLSYARPSFDEVATDASTAVGATVAGGDAQINTT